MKILSFVDDIQHNLKLSSQSKIFIALVRSLILHAVFFRKSSIACQYAGKATIYMRIFTK